MCSCYKRSTCLNSVRSWAPEECLPLCKTTCLLPHPSLPSHPYPPIYWRQPKYIGGSYKKAWGETKTLRHNARVSKEMDQHIISTQRTIKCIDHSAKIRYQELYVVMKKAPEELSSIKTTQSLEPEASLLPYFKWFTGKVTLVKKVYCHSVRLNKDMDAPIRNPFRPWASSTSGFYPDLGKIFFLL